MTVIDDFRMDGHVCVVTGGGRGIGEGIALCMAEAGADVVVAARRKHDVESVVQKIEDRGRRGLAVSIDLMEKNAVRELVDAAVNKFGKISIWVNNAGGSESSETYYIDETPVDYWEWMIKFNLTIPFEGAKWAIPHIPKNGSIINIVSGAGLNAAPHTGAYGAAKAGVISLTNNLAFMWAPHNINVNCILPGLTATDELKGYGIIPTSPDKNGKEVPRLNLPPGPEDVANLTLFLASPASDALTGELYPIRAWLKSERFWQ